jgi:excisionase family DNA binding protein
MTEPISLIEAAERLGVHYMTAYRYVRTGRLAAQKVGGQWRVEGDDLTAFLAAPTGTTPRGELLPGLIEERLLAGDENGTYQLLENAMASGAGPEEAYLELIAPAMTEIGARWARGEVSVADEHVASSTALRVIARLGPRALSRGRTKGTVLLATVANDYHYLPTAILRDLLRFRGFDVQDLGANTPAQSIVDRSKTVSDLLAIGISATLPGQDELIRETISLLSKEVAVPVVVGGSAFADDDHILSLGDCLPSASAHQALKIFDAIHADRRTTPR